eukprot:m.267374 g.267374  ORF g.267374 m.267374 type:complete len:175 (+) comp40512_c0_seq10:100-624(+)
MSVKLKILVIGPAESGKTFISNFLVDDVEPTGKYRPTTGVRIVEVKNQSNADVELWDCSGSKQYESCWPALWKDAHGAMLVTTPQKTSEIKTWHEQFVQHGLKESQLFLVCNSYPSNGRSMHDLGSQFKNVMQCQVDFDKDPENLRDQFNEYLGKVIGAVAEKRDMEELSIMNN